MSEEREVAKSTALISGLTMISRVLGMVRDMVIARIYSAGAIADCFFVAFSLPATMARLLGDGGFTISFVPVFTEELEKKGRQEAMKLAYTTFWIALVFILVITVLGIIFAPWLVRIIAPGFGLESGKMEIATRLTRQIFPYTILVCIVALAMGILNSFKHFAMPALSPVLLNLSMIASVLIVNERYDFFSKGMSLVIGVLAGGIFQVLVQVPTLWRYGFRFRAYFDLAHPGLRKMGQMMGVSVFGVMVYQLNVFINTFFVSEFSGGRSYIYYADRLVELPLAIFGIALGTAILPSFSRYSAHQDLKGLAKTLNFGLNFVLFMIVPAIIGLIFFRLPIISVIYQGVNFTMNDSLNTATALLFYSLGVWASAGLRVIVPSYYSLKDARTPVMASATAMLVNLVGCWLFTKEISWTREHLGFAGVCLATMIASIINFFIHILLLRRKLPGFIDGSIFTNLAKSLLACLPMILFSFWIADKELWLEPGRIWEKIGWLGLSILFSGFFYFALAWLLGMPELKWLKEFIQNRSKR